MALKKTVTSVRTRHLIHTVWPHYKLKTGLCAVKSYDYRAKRCPVQCNECKTVETMNRYAYGLLPPNYPVPALPVDCVADLGERWSNWMDS